MENVERELRIPRSWMESEEDFAMECGRPHRPTPPRRPHCPGWAMISARVLMKLISWRMKCLWRRLSTCPQAAAAVRSLRYVRRAAAAVITVMAIIRAAVVAAAAAMIRMIRMTTIVQAAAAVRNRRYVRRAAAVITIPMTRMTMIDRAAAIVRAMIATAAVTVMTIMTRTMAAVIITAVRI